MTEAQHQQPAEEPRSDCPQRDAQSLLIITHLCGHPTRRVFQNDVGHG